ncbi:nuclear transport factor 2 family protein [Streptomyces chrestomyceticus]|uniref:nuclear transport factor 2 family protein n=1 Tax=Streptomyces chrestomyceticus TaxID=68185 RepID=UPI003530A9DE
MDETEGGFGLFEGREAIRAFFRDSLMANSTHVVHMMFNHLITSIEGDHGEGRVNCLVEIMKTDGSCARAHVTYNDRYVRVAGRWKFAGRVNHLGLPARATHARRVKPWSRWCSPTSIAVSRCGLSGSPDTGAASRNAEGLHRTLVQPLRHPAPDDGCAVASRHPAPDGGTRGRQGAQAQRFTKSTAAESTSAGCEALRKC